MLKRKFGNFFSNIAMEFSTQFHATFHTILHPIPRKILQITQPLSTFDSRFSNIHLNSVWIHLNSSYPITRSVEFAFNNFSAILSNQRFQSAKSYSIVEFSANLWVKEGQQQRRRREWRSRIIKLHRCWTLSFAKLTPLLLLPPSLNNSNPNSASTCFTKSTSFVARPPFPPTPLQFHAHG